ncbi:hypothetical protein HDU89_005818 [Geranomyces variabilis]|nr:hypothetical protein HDU89_005818 [Geranomyces variabilis]
MLLLDDGGLITHLNVLLIGSAHVGKSSLRKAFIRGPSSHGISKTRTRGPWRSVYDPTIEDCNIVQYVVPLPPNAPQLAANAAGGPRSPVESLSSASTISNEQDSDNAKDAGQMTEEDLWQKNLGQRIILTLSDVGGHPFYGTIWASAIAAADAFIMVYDVGNRQSFDAIFGFYRQILEVKCARPAHLPIMLLGNMVDNVTSDPSSALPDKRPRQVTRDMGDALAKLLRVSFNETSAMAPKSVTHCFRQLLTSAQEHAQTLMAAGLVVKADAMGPSLTTQSVGRRPSDASFGSDDTILKNPQSTIAPGRGSADRVYGQVGRNIDPHGRRGSAGASRDSMSTNLSEGSAISAGKPTGNLIVTNPSTASMVSSRPGSGASSSDGIRDLAAPRPDSIRFRRDMIFRAWKAFQSNASSALPLDGPAEDSRNLLRSLVSSSGSSGSRPTSPLLPRTGSGTSSHGPMSGHQVPASRSDSLTPHSSLLQKAPPANSTPASPHKASGAPLEKRESEWERMASESDVSSLYPTLSSNATSNTNPFSSSSRLTSTSSGSGFDIGLWEGPPISDQMRERARESGWRSPQPRSPQIDSTTTSISTSPAHSHAVRRYRSSNDIALESSRVASRVAVLQEPSPSLHKSQRDLEMLLRELSEFGFDDGGGDNNSQAELSPPQPQHLPLPTTRPPVAPQFGMTRSRSMGQMKDHGERTPFIPIPVLNTLVEEEPEMSPPDDHITLPSSLSSQPSVGATAQPTHPGFSGTLGGSTHTSRNPKVPLAHEPAKPNMDLLRSILAELDENEARKIVEEFALRGRSSTSSSGTASTGAVVPPSPPLSGSVASAFDDLDVDPERRAQPGGMVG